jgi:hypothetical protein
MSYQKKPLGATKQPWALLLAAVLVALCACAPRAAEASVRLKFVNGFPNDTHVTVEVDAASVYSYTWTNPGFVGYVAFAFGAGGTSHTFYVLNAQGSVIAQTTNVLYDGDNYTVLVTDAAPYVQVFYDNTTFTPGSNDYLNRFFLATANLGSGLDLLAQETFEPPRTAATGQAYGSEAQWNQFPANPTGFETYNFCYCNPNVGCEGCGYGEGVQMPSKSNTLGNCYVISNGSTGVIYMVDIVTP